MKEIYANFHKYGYTWIRNLIKKFETFDISATLFANVAFVFFHVMEGVRGRLRGRGFQLLLMSYNSAVRGILEDECDYVCWMAQEMVR